MSKQTFFRRAALVVVASLGLSFVSIPSSQATGGTTLVTAALSLGSGTATASTNDTATGTWVATWTTNDATFGDSVSVKYGCSASVGAGSCPAIEARQVQTADTVNIVLNPDRNSSDVNGAAWVNISGATGWMETSTAGANVSARSSVAFKAKQFSKPGTYTYTFYLTAGASSAALTGTTNTWVVTVTNADTAGRSVSRSYFAPTDAQAVYARYSNGAGNPGASTDSSIVTSAGTTASPALAGVLYAVPAHSSGDTAVVVAGVRYPVQDTLTASITGAGTISTNSGTTKAGSATMNITSSSYVGYTGESVAVYSNGTVGTATLTLTNSSNVVVYTKTITFTGPAASAGISFTDTYTSIGQTLTLNARVLDSGSNALGAGTLYVFSSDTKIVSAGASLYSNASTQYQTIGRCSSWSGTVLSCSLTTADTGTASIYLADSWNVTAASFVTTALTLTVTGNTIVSATVAFDKATYVPGERAVITITAKDRADRVLATGASGTFNRILQTPILTGVTSLPYRGTSSSDATSATSMTIYSDSGVETRVVTMPTYSSDVSYSVVVPGFGTGILETIVTATAKVVNPNDTAAAAAIAAAQAAANAAGAAATDAALEAIDAANAATDAANLSAEAADAATVAAEEARDAADAATAAVEELATQVATLMAALKAQITTLANTVAKIAKKVKA